MEKGISEDIEDVFYKSEKCESSSDQILGLTLSEFEQGDCAIEIQVPWLDDAPLWFAPGEPEAAVLMSEGVSRGRIWTTLELRDLMSIPGLDLEKVRTIQHLKDEFDGFD